MLVESSNATTSNDLPTISRKLANSSLVSKLERSLGMAPGISTNRIRRFPGSIGVLLRRHSAVILPASPANMQETCAAMGLMFQVRIILSPLFRQKPSSYPDQDDFRSKPKLLHRHVANYNSDMSAVTTQVKGRRKNFECGTV